MSDPLAQDLQIVEGVSFRLSAKRTCKGCPWRKDAVPGALGGWAPRMYVEAASSPADIACHMSKDFDGHVQAHSDPEASRPRSCTGLAAFRFNADLPVSAHPLSGAVSAIIATAQQPEALAEVFDSAEEFLRHHETPEAREARFWRADRAGCGTRKRTGSGEGE